MWHSLISAQPTTTRNKEFNMNPNEFYEKCLNTKSDINEHLPVLKELASRCNTVVEFGVRTGVSTMALLMGKPKKLLSFDVSPFGSKDLYDNYADLLDVSFAFHQENVLTTTKVPSCDMIFIDTLHSYLQLSLELFLHAYKANKYIVFHDTISFAGHDEGQVDTRVLSGMAMSLVRNIENNGKRGLLPAINEFLEQNPEWSIAASYTHNNGLLVLERK